MWTSSVSSAPNMVGNDSLKQMFNGVDSVQMD